MTTAMPRPGGSTPAGPGPMYWDVPSPYGYAAAVDTAGTVAAPLLAGFALTLIGLILGLGSPETMPLREPAVVPLLIAVVSLLACVQCTFWAKQYAVTPTQILEWWPDAESGRTGAAPRQEMLRRDQRRYAVLVRRWQGVSAWTYDAGILALLGSLPLVLAPPPGWTQPWRWLAVSLAGLAFLGELYWVVAPRTGWMGAGKVFPDLSSVTPQPAAYTGPLPQR